jgi:hypothetical protein
MERKLRNSLNRFQREMKQRLAEKEQEGFTGWDGSWDYSPKFIRRIFTKARKIKAGEDVKKNAVDIANLAMMIWYNSGA